MADGFRRKMFAALTGRPGDVSGEGEDFRGMLMAAFGTSTKTKSSVDVKAAAKSMRVTVRTVQRWLKAAEDGRRPGVSSKNFNNVARRSRQAATTKRGRSRAARQKRQSIPSHGAKLYLSARHGPFGEGELDYKRRRTTYVTLSPEDYENVLAAYEEAGENGSLQYLEYIWASGYLGNAEERWEVVADDQFKIWFGSRSDEPSDN